MKPTVFPKTSCINRRAWKACAPNFALKLSEKPHLGAKRLTIRRLIAA